MGHPIPLKLKLSALVFTALLLGWGLIHLLLVVVLPGWAEAIFVAIFDRFMLFLLLVAFVTVTVVLLYTIWRDQQVFNFPPPGEQPLT